MELSRLGRGDIVAACGGVVLLVSLFLPWYSVNPQENLCGSEHCSAFQTFNLLDILLVAAALAPWILVWIVVRANQLSWPPGEVTMASAMTAIVLILYNGLLDQPGENQNFVSLDYGWFLALAGTLAIAVGGAMSQVARGGVRRKPPGSF